MLTLADNIARLWRYEIKAQEEGQEIVLHALSEEEKEMFSAQYPEAEVNPIIQTENEWIEGKKFLSRDEAVKALEMGEENYKSYLLQNDAELMTAAYLLDIDSRLLLMEWGLL